MSAEPAAGPVTVEGAGSVVPALRPRYASANIRTWIGFKQFMELAQEAVLGWFRQRGFGPRHLFHECGVGLRVLDSSVLLPAVLEVDDEVTAEVTRNGVDTFTVRLRAGGGAAAQRVLRGKVTVALVPEAAAEAGVDVPDELRAMLGSAPEGGGRPPAPPDGFGWNWRVRYFHCHYSDVVQHSTYVAALEEAVDRFLHEVGLSVPSVLSGRGWIPVVSRARVTLHGDARMDEVVRTTFGVDDVVAGRAFEGRMACHVVEGGRRRMVADGTILHGYAMTKGERAGELAELGDEMTELLLGKGVR
ncbi:thioesterase family protein [Qaidamihabitans albus]|uniref:thioesterase family protein n=1 Tax=Qaidamihabitans albus TaxID=2795733 RepID=UPI0018F1293E|nr:thioesterase family protein [Qaidamihabitans albus]